MFRFRNICITLAWTWCTTLKTISSCNIRFQIIRTRVTTCMSFLILIKTSRTFGTFKYCYLNVSIEIWISLEISCLTLFTCCISCFVRIILILTVRTRITTYLARIWLSETSWARKTSRRTTVFCNCTCLARFAFKSGIYRITGILSLCFFFPCVDLKKLEKTDK